MEHIWTILMLKILQAHLLLAFVANLKIGAIYVLYPESFCDKNPAIRKLLLFVTLELSHLPFSARNAKLMLFRSKRIGNIITLYSGIICQ